MEPRRQRTRDPDAMRLPRSDERRPGDPAHDAARGSRRGRAGERRCGKQPDRALRARAGLPSVRRAATRGALAGRRDRRRRLRGSARCGRGAPRGSPARAPCGARTTRPFLHPGKAAETKQAGSASSIRRFSRAPGASSSSMSRSDRSDSRTDPLRRRDHVTRRSVRMSRSSSRRGRGSGACRCRARGAARRSSASPGSSTSTAGSRSGEGRKSVALRLSFQAPDRTLSDDDAADVRERIVAALGEQFGAELRGRYYRRFRIPEWESWIAKPLRGPPAGPDGRSLAVASSGWDTARPKGRRIRLRAVA